MIEPSLLNKISVNNFDLKKYIYQLFREFADRSSLLQKLSQPIKVTLNVY